MEKILFAPLTKVVELDDGTLEVWGRAAAQEPDSQGEVFDYEASKPFIKSWSDDIFAASGGKSLGNLRAMHNPRIAAGKLTKLEFNDPEQAVDVAAQVIDAEEVKKTRAGMYTGFSLGGKYGPKRKEGNLVYYAAVPSEISLADNPMIKSARFTLVKADGSEEEVEALGKMEPAGELQKRLHHVRQMAIWLYDGRCLLGDVVYEAQGEGDGSAIPARLQQTFLDLVEIFKEFAAEEANEMAADVAGLLMGKPGPLAMVLDQGELEKNMKPEDLQKLDGALASLAKLEADFADQGTRLAKVETENQELINRLAKVEAQPAPALAAAQAVTKEEDGDLKKTDAPTPEELMKNKDTLGLIKRAHESPQTIMGR